MNLNEKLNAKEMELKALATQIEAGEAEAIESAETLTGEIENLKGLIEKAAKANATIAKIGNNEKAEAVEEDSIKAAHVETLKEQKGSKTFAFKAYNDNETAPTVNVVDNKVVDAHPALTVRSLFGSEAINGNSLTYFKLSQMEGDFAKTAEGAAKPQVHIPYSSTTVALQKIAGFMKETDELLSDAAFLESAIRGRGVYEFNKAVEAYLVGELTKAGIQVGQTTITFDNILKAKQAVRTATGYAADSILINPADLEALLVSKDSNNQYLLGGPAYGSYGNGTYNANPRIWGLDVVESSEVPAGAAIVGAFKVGASVVTKAGEGLRVEVSNSDQDDFIKNRITVRVEERLVLATRVPTAFVLVGTVSSSS
jgi:HK97 family phage major capsid protein